MWASCPTEQDQPVTIPYFGIQLQDAYAGAAVAGIAFFVFSPLHGLGFGALTILVLTVLKHGKAPGWMFHVLWTLDLWHIPGALRACRRTYTIW